MSGKTAPAGGSAALLSSPSTKSKPNSNGLSKPIASSPASLCPPSRHNSLSQSQRGSVADEMSIGEIFRLIAQMKICVIRRAGSDVESQISAVIDALAANPIQNGHVNGGGGGDVNVNDEEEEVNGVNVNGTTTPTLPITHFLTVGQQSALKMLDWVQRKGLPLIFLNGDCIGGLSEFKALEKSGFLASALRPHQFDLIVIGEGEMAQKAVEEAAKLGKKVVLVEMIRPAESQSTRNGRLAKEAINQTALMRTAIEEARSSGWTVEGEQGQKVSFWLDWQTVREGIALKEEAESERTNAIYKQGKVQRYRALTCQFSGFHELTVCPDQESAEQFRKDGLLRLTATRFLLATKSEQKSLENVPGARENCIPRSELFTMDYNPGKTIFCCGSNFDPGILECAAILRALGNDVTLMECTTFAVAPSKSETSTTNSTGFYDTEMMQEIKESLAQKGVRFIMCVPTKFEKLREPVAGRAGVVRVYAMDKTMTKTPQEGGGESEGEGATDTSVPADWNPFLEEFNTVVLCLGQKHPHQQEPFQGLGLEKLSSSLLFSPRGGGGMGGQQNGRHQQQSACVPNIYAIVGTDLEEGKGGALTDSLDDGDADGWNCFRAKQLIKRIFQGELNQQIVRTDLCRTLLVPPCEYSCCGLDEQEAERKHGKQALNVYRDEEVPMPMPGIAPKAKMICLKHEQDKVIGLHLMCPNASQLLQGYSLSMQLGLTRAMMEMMSGK